MSRAVDRFGEDLDKIRRELVIMQSKIEKLDERIKALEGTKKKKENLNGDRGVIY